MKNGRASRKRMCKSVADMQVGSLKSHIGLPHVGSLQVSEVSSRTSVCLTSAVFKSHIGLTSTLCTSGLGCALRTSIADVDFNMEYTPWLIVGLGNPGNKYHGTRHNVGFEMINRISQAEGIPLNTVQSKALIGIGYIDEVPVLLAKPQAYMNYSGESVGPLAAYYRVPLRYILLVYDEMSLPNGVLRIQQKGGHGYNNGVKSVIEHLDGRRDFPRFCIGVGNPPGTMDMKAFLLQKFSSIEQKQIDVALEQGVEAVRALVMGGFNSRITRFNLGQKYKYHKV